MYKQTRISFRPKTNQPTNLKKPESAVVGMERTVNNTTEQPPETSSLIDKVENLTNRAKRIRTGPRRLANEMPGAENSNKPIKSFPKPPRRTMRMGTTKSKNDGIKVVSIEPKPPRKRTKSKSPLKKTKKYTNKKVLDTDTDETEVESLVDVDEPQPEEPANVTIEYRVMP